MLHRNFVVGLFAALAFAQIAAADDVRVYKGDDGVTYRETHRIVKQPVSETQYVDHPYTVYSEQVSTELQPNNRTVYTPVTEYTWEPYMAGRWNPFTSPHVEYRYVPHTRWDVRTEQTQIPVTKRQLVPVQGVTRVPVTTMRMADVEQTERMAVRSDTSTATASTQSIGGVANLQGNDPPRQGMDRR
jgi:hypothetical protein